MFQPLYKLKINDISLRELLVWLSIYVCKNMEDIQALVLDQPKPTLFYKSCLELDGQSFVSILAFDNRSMKHLLGDHFAENFSDEYPLFYKSKL